MTSIANIVSDDSPVVIVDIGASLANDELPIYGGLLSDGKARLIAFEPDADAFSRLLEKYPAPHVCLPWIVGNGAPGVFYETNWGPTGSLFEPNLETLEKFHDLAEITRLVRKHEVSTIRLDDINEANDVDLIKVDAQGAELMIFESSPRTLSEATLIHTEVCFVELYKGMPLFGDIDRCLRAAGFQWHTRIGCGYRSFVPLKNGNEPDFAFNQELWADVIYVRDWMQFDRLSPRKLVKLAVLLHDLYRSFDLAHLAFASADRQTGSNFAENYGKWLSGG